MTFGKAFDGEFAIDHSTDNAAITGGQCTIYNQDIPRMNPRLPHGLASHSNKKGCGGMLDEVLIEVQGAIEVVISRGRISSRNGNQEQEASVSGRDIRRSHYVHVH